MNVWKKMAALLLSCSFLLGAASSLLAGPPIERLEGDFAYFQETSTKLLEDYQTLKKENKLFSVSSERDDPEFYKVVRDMDRDYLRILDTYDSVQGEGLKPEDPKMQEVLKTVNEIYSKLEACGYFHPRRLGEQAIPEEDQLSQLFFRFFRARNYAMEKDKNGARYSVFEVQLTAGKEERQRLLEESQKAKSDGDKSKTWDLDKNKYFLSTTKVIDQLQKEIDEELKK